MPPLNENVYWKQALTTLVIAVLVALLSSSIAYGIGARGYVDARAEKIEMRLDGIGEKVGNLDRRMGLVMFHLNIQDPESGLRWKGER